MTSGNSSRATATSSAPLHAKPAHGNFAYEMTTFSPDMSDMGDRLVSNVGNVRILQGVQADECDIEPVIGG